MKLFKCTHCQQLVYFENDRCEQCQYPLGFDPTQLRIVALQEHADQSFQQVGNPQQQQQTYRYCANHAEQACNWLVPAASPEEFCRACALNSTIPKLSKPEHRQRWLTLEKAKHRLVYTLLRLGLPLVSKTENPDTGLAFDFLADKPEEGGQKVMTGHDNGLITINIAEADDIEREMARKAMHEVYRTVLGHFRHEVGHYYWDRLVDNTAWLEEFRQLFGDDRQDYGEALKVHYDQGAPTDWQEHFISEYATTHPWEDWAETWAHYLHIVDTLETAHAFGLEINPGVAPASAQMSADICLDPYHLDKLDTILDLWVPLTFALNSLNRSMGLPDPYPFIINPDVRRKLDFVHRVCHQPQLSPVQPTLQ
ncbi:zinc-binding metallopeptidase family protein [Hymenobacter cellulosilyticus]|uniref:Putative zinc-binding peptidase n=1 Tax=Hymenobacter cellulosilyticus TaxID=2932248 RepID=A0A8T9Q0A2_9BACT|nr:putative zinc-binding peptidase [Hymenobacter cellulosilyticus]UOQ71196.1 putative zinc-binding peptidase [Hymenobacter cellulosilyticus]